MADRDRENQKFNSYVKGPLTTVMKGALSTAGASTTLARTIPSASELTINRVEREIETLKATLTRQVLSSVERQSVIAMKKNLDDIRTAASTNRDALRHLTPVQKTHLVAMIDSARPSIETKMNKLLPQGRE